MREAGATASHTSTESSPANSVAAIRPYGAQSRAARAGGRRSGRRGSGRSRSGSPGGTSTSARSRNSSSRAAAGARRRRAGRAGSSRVLGDLPQRPLDPAARVLPVARDRVPEHARVAAGDERVDGGLVEQARLEVAALARGAEERSRAARAGRAAPAWPRSPARAPSPSEPSGRGCVSVWLPIQWPSATARSASSRMRAQLLARRRRTSPSTPARAGRPGPGASPPGPVRCRRSG